MKGLIFQRVDYGTPQGSCLGPLIFLLFCNDLYLHLDYLSSIQFADDTTLYHGCRHLKYSKFCIESDLNVIEDWLAANKLTLNVGKTVLMLFKPKTKQTSSNVEKTELNISLNGEKIPCKTHTKFLGLFIDENLSWDHHIANLILRIRSRLGLLRKGKNLLTKHAKKILYYAQMHSLLQIWNYHMETSDPCSKIEESAKTTKQVCPTYRPPIPH